MVVTPGYFGPSLPRLSKTDVQLVRSHHQKTERPPGLNKWISSKFSFS
jgi:hypothetical protein